MCSKFLYYNEDLPADINLEGDLAIDTEATGLNLFRDKLCLVQICDENGKIYLVKFSHDSKYNSPVLKSYIEDPSRQKIFHFARFDVGMIKKYLQIKKIDNIFCTKIASYFTRTYTSYHGLRSIVSELLNKDLKKDQQTTDWSKDELTVSQQFYAANDVRYLHQLRDKLSEMLTRSGRFDVFEKHSNFINFVTDANILGFDGDLFSHSYSQ